MRTLYITFDGILEPLGHAQVARVVAALSAQGHPYVLLSLEKASRLRDAKRVAAMRRFLEEADVPWIMLPYATGSSARAAGENVARAIWDASRAVRRFGVRLVHARTYHAAAVALTLRRTLGIPYLFDTRGYWIDERAEEGRWFTRPRAYRAGKAVERALYRGAAGIVSLTQLQVDDLRGGLMGNLGGRPMEVITTIADFDEFRLERRATLPADVGRAVQGKTVIGWVGSFNVSYLVEPTLALMRSFLSRRADGIVLALTAQIEACHEAFANAGVPRERTIVREVPHDEMPGWLPHLDWVPLLLKTSFGKRASMPTKLGELLASGVRPVHHGCNSEVEEWIRRTGSGISLPTVARDALDAVVERMGPRAGETEPVLAHARHIAEPHFALKSGIARYRAILDALGAPSSSRAVIRPQAEADRGAA